MIKMLVRLIVRVLPNSVLGELQDAGLKELDSRGEIIWADKIDN